MKIAALCSRRVVTIDAQASLAHAAVLMRQHHVDVLVVTASTPQGTRVAGTLSDRDIVIEVLARSLDAATVTAGQLAGNTVASVAETDEVATAIATLQAGGVRRLLVLDGDQVLVGIVTLDDLVLACARDMAGLAGVLRSAQERELAATTPPPHVQRMSLPRGNGAAWAASLP